MIIKPGDVEQMRRKESRHRHQTEEEIRKLPVGSSDCEGPRGSVDYQLAEGWLSVYECFIVPLD